MERSPVWSLTLPMTEDQLYTIKEVAARLRLAEKTVYAMASTGELPAFKIRGQWRVRSSELTRWVDMQPRGGGDVRP